jgi:hypothetical protein
MDKEITHEIQCGDLDGVYTQAGAAGTGSDLGRNFYQLDILHMVRQM